MRIWLSNGGAWWFNIKNDEIKERITTLFAEMPYLIEVKTSLGKVGIIHAEVPIDYSDWEQLKQNLNDWTTVDSALWGRKRLNNKNDEIINNIDLVVCGHTPLVEPVRLGNHLFIDNSGWLLQKFVLLNSEEIFSPQFIQNDIFIK